MNSVFKRLALIAIYLVVTVTYVAAAEPNQGVPAENYGESVVRAAWERFAFDLEALNYSPLADLNSTENYLVSRLVRMRWMMERLPPEFLPGTDTRFQVKPGEKPRSAFTGNTEYQRIYFNQDKIKNSLGFDYTEAVNLLIHEMGHKIKEDIFYQKMAKNDKEAQTMIDTLAGKIQSAIKERVKPLAISGHSNYQLNWVNSDPKRMNELPYRSSYNYPKPWVALVNGEQVYDLTYTVFHHHDLAEQAESPPHKFRRQNVESVQIRPGINSGAVHLDVELSYWPLRAEGDDGEYLTLYTNEDLEMVRVPVQLPVKDKSLRIDDSGVRIWQYYPLANEDLDLSVVVDAYSFKNGQLRFEGKIHSDNHWQYRNPWSGSLLLVEVDGERLELPLKTEDENPFSQKHWQWQPMDKKNQFLNSGTYYLPFSVDPLELGEGSLSKFRVLGVQVQTYTQKEGSITRILPMASPVEGELSPWLHSNLGEQHYFQDLRVHQPTDHGELFQGTTFGLGPGDLVLKFSGKSALTSVKLTFTFQRKSGKTETLERTYKDIDSSGLTRINETDYEVQLPMRFFQPMSKAEIISQLAYGSQTHEAIESFQLKEVHGHLSDGSEYHEAFDFGPKLDFHMGATLSTSEIRDAIKKRCEGMFE